MADQKVSDLPSLNGADVDAADLLYIVDSSAGAAGSKKITIGQYQLAPVSGGTANTVVYLNGSKVESSSSALTFDGTNFATTGTSSAAKLIPTGGTATGNGMYLPAANTLAWSNNGAETMRLDSSGNLGLGVTPSAWGTGFKAAQIDAQSAVTGSATNTYLSTNWYFTTSDRYIANGLATIYRQNAGQHIWYNAPNNTSGAGAAATFTQAMTLDASGNLLVGTTNSELGAGFGNIQIQGSSGAIVQAQTGAGTVKCAISADSAKGNVGTRTNHPVLFTTNNTERARITSGGNFLVGATSGGSYPSAMQTLSSDSGTTKWDFGPYSTATNFLISSGTGGVQLVGTATSWSALSDERLKIDLEPIQNAAKKVASLRAVTGRYKTDASDVSRAFLIAQDVQAVLPEAVNSSKIFKNDDTEYLGLQYTDTIPLLVAAIKEQQALITALTARVAALEAK